MPRGLRSTSGTPTSASSRASCWDTADGVSFSASAAASTPPLREICRKYGSRATLILIFTHSKLRILNNSIVLNRPASAE
jgi:hypothetical protein